MAKAKAITIDGVEFASASAAARKMLIETNLKQSDIAKMVGIKPQTVHRIMLVTAGIRRK